jgi:hypothetical protein
MAGLRYSGCAGALLLLAGCWTDGSSLHQRWLVVLRSRELPGTPATVADAAVTFLSQKRLFVSKRRDGEGIRLDSTSPSGKRFTLHLSAETFAGAQQTRARIDWEKEADQAFWDELQEALIRATSDGGSRERKP